MAQSNDVPIVSRVLPDGTMIEALFDASATTFAVRRPDGVISTTDCLAGPTGERFVPYSADNNLLTSGCILLPSDVGDVGDTGDVIEAIGDYLDRYVDLSPDIRAAVPYYVLLTWVYDAFAELPYLRFRGDWGSGKTRCLLAVGSICYKPFFASGASTVSPIFHILDAVGGTLVLDEADLRFSDATADLTKVLNNGNVRGLPVLRTMTNRNRELSPKAFTVFGPKLLAMRERFQDDALESRFLTEETRKRDLPAHIPIHLPKSLATEATELRNMLLRWRLEHRHEIEPKLERHIAGASARTNQMAYAMLSLIEDEAIRDQVSSLFVQGSRDISEARRQSADGRVIEAAVAAFSVANTPSIGVAAITYHVNKKSSQDELLPVSPKWVGSVLHRLGVRTRKSHGVYVLEQTERALIWQLAEAFGIVIPNEVMPSAPEPGSDLLASF